MNNPFFNDTRPSKKAVSTKEIDASVEDADGRPSCYDGDQQCGSYYIRNWAILMWSLLAISVASTTIAIVLLVEYVSLSAEQSDAVSEFVNVSHAPHFPPYDSTCIIGEDLAAEQHEQHMHECTNNDPRIYHRVVLSRKPYTAEDAQNKQEQAFLDEKVLLEHADSPGHDNVHVSGYQAPGMVARLHIRRGLQTMEQATKAGLVQGVEQGTSAVAARTTYGALQKVGDVIRSRKSTWTQAIIHPFYHHLGTTNTMISTSHHAWFKFANGKVVHTVLKETGGGLHAVHPHLAPLVHDLHGVITRVFPVAKHLLSAFVAGRRLSLGQYHMWHYHPFATLNFLHHGDVSVGDDCKSTATIARSSEKTSSIPVVSSGATTRSTSFGDEEQPSSGIQSAETHGSIIHSLLQNVHIAIRTSKFRSKLTTAFNKHHTSQSAKQPSGSHPLLTHVKAAFENWKSHHTSKSVSNNCA